MKNMSLTAFVLMLASACTSLDDRASQACNGSTNSSCVYEYKQIQLMKTMAAMQALGYIQQNQYQYQQQEPQNTWCWQFGNGMQCSTK